MRKKCVRVHAAAGRRAPRAPRTPGRRRPPRDMQPARKLLSLLFLILMGTELTQVRASNAIFLPACEAPARPGPGKVGEPLRTARRPPGPGAAAGLGRGPAARGMQEGAQADPRLLLCPPGPSALSPSSRTPGCPLPAEKFKGQRRGPFGSHCHPRGGPSRRSERSELGGGCDPTPAPASLPLATVAALGAPELAVGMVPGRPDQGGQAAVSEAGVHCGLHVEV